MNPIKAKTKDWLPPVLHNYLNRFVGSENNTRFEGSYSTWQEANARCKGYDNINDYYLYSPRDIDIARMTWVADKLSI